MPKRDFKRDENPLMDNNEVLSLEEADAMLYGKTDMKIESGRVTAYPIDIFKLSADRTQPRRAVPLSIRGDWDGSAHAVPDLLQRWHAAANKELSQHIPISIIFEDGEIDISIEPRQHPIADKFMSLVYLADSIRRDGLMNPIQISRSGDNGQIDRGERRWLAHHLLHQLAADTEKWGQIPAVDVEPDVWAQAQENGNRSPLNAIEMARQLALLLMDMYADEVSFESYDALIKKGSDRWFYAQVADGNLFNVKRGYMDRILGATGLKSRHQVGRYRDLLNLDDANWRHADEKNWSEGRCRRILHPDWFTDKNEDDEPQDEKTDDMLSIDNTTSDKLPSPTVQTDPKSVEIGQIRAVDEQDYPYLVVLKDDGVNMFRCELCYKDGKTYQLMARTNIAYGFPVVRGHKSIDIIKVGQIRTRDENEDVPYILIKQDLGRGDWKVLVASVNGDNEQIISENGIYQYWPIVLDYVPEITPQDNNLEVGSGDSQRYFTPVNPGVSKSDKPKGIEVPLGSEIPTYPKSDEDDNWDSQQRRPPIYQNGDTQRDQVDDMPFITFNKEFNYLLSNWLNLAHQMDMKREHDMLRHLSQWTPASVRDKVSAAGKEAIDDDIEEVEQALTSILESFKQNWTDFVLDILEVAAKAGEDGA